MYVCICRGITEKQIRQVAQQRPCSMQELSAVTGVGVDCGSCTEYACQLLQDLGNQGCDGECLSVGAR
ncbi:MAG: glycoprotein [Limnothrix sp. RL_2_0]|nr:glycoprotein [Limnothrix sp. RL_2_0]